MKIIITCHTEFGYVKNSKEIIFDNTSDGVSIGVRNILKLAERHNVKVCFLLKPEVIKYSNSEILNEIINKNHQIGLHIHPDDRYLIENGISDGKSLALRDYNYQKQREFIKVGSELIKENFGIIPKVFAAGRWSENNDTIKALIDEEFTHDCSPYSTFYSEYCNWSKLNRITMPYRPSINSYQEQGNLPIIMLPVSFGIFKTAAQIESIREVGVSFLKACFLEYYMQRLPVFHICFHSNTMTNDYFVTALDKLLKFITKYNNIEFVLPTQIEEDNNIRTKTIISPYIMNMNRKLIKTIILLTKDKIKRWIK